MIIRTCTFNGPTGKVENLCKNGRVEARIIVKWPKCKRQTKTIKNKPKCQTRFLYFSQMEVTKGFRTPISVMFVCVCVCIIVSIIASIIQYVIQLCNTQWW